MKPIGIMSNGRDVTETVWLIWPLLVEKHQRGLCTCSYCKDGRTGLVLPQCRCWNAWRSVRWYWRDGYWCIRWTMPRWWPRCKLCAPNN